MLLLRFLLPALLALPLALLVVCYSPGHFLAAG
jgi:hypothetical protein